MLLRFRGVTALVIALAVAGGVACTSDSSSQLDSDLNVDYSKFSSEDAVLRIDDLPEGFTEMERRAPSLSGEVYLGGSMSRFLSDDGLRYVFSEVAVLNVTATPVAGGKLAFQFKVTGFAESDIEMGETDEPKPGSGYARALGSSDLIPFLNPEGGPVPIVFDVISFAEGQVYTIQGIAYPEGSSPEPSAQEIAQITLDRIRAQVQELATPEASPAP